MGLALPNASFWVKNSPVAPRGGGGKSGGALPKLPILCPITAFIGPKRPQKAINKDKRREMVGTLHKHVDRPVTKGPLLPSNYTTGPRNGPQKAKNGMDCANFVSINTLPKKH